MAREAAGARGCWVLGSGETRKGKGERELGNGERVLGNGERVLGKGKGRASLATLWSPVL
jgi:hypothetical protein